MRDFAFTVGRIEMRAIGRDLAGVPWSTPAGAAFPSDFDRQPVANIVTRNASATTSVGHDLRDCLHIKSPETITAIQ